MLLIPAIDLKDGKCVRLRQGRMEEATLFSDDPLAMADRWVAAGARRLHLVDLNGAFAGRPVNAEVIRCIADAFPGIPIQVGGGIRDEETVDAYLNAGVQFVIIGTRAVQEPHFVNNLCLEYPGHVMGGLDARDGRVAVDGWSRLARQDVVEVARRFERDGVEAIVYTDISRDGMMQGVNVAATVALARAVAIPIIASGGVASLDDIRALAAVEAEGVVGAIIGRALYEGSIDLAAALALAAGR
ncbi:MAG: 1-(5-phosphoribosyl)-5-[(5-phosphoribosylamino)methylideneamino]imidazole-4-carboxamide isomerase [Pseudomonadota bacterium]|nr:1-(5-phosphoribosyl)-5-[(5-phosphoribosylamino)methylideneamino]imidazole-4-carboxamide isomerase [Pseudomonadota bacterium]